MPPSKLLGREPHEHTEYHYDEPAELVSAARWRWMRALFEWAHRVAHPPRLAGTTTYRQPEWLDSDREAVIAALLIRRTTGSHGQPLDEAMSPDADPSNWAATRRYVVKPPARDFATKALREAQEEYRKKYPDADFESLRWRVESVDLDPNDET